MTYSHRPNPGFDPVPRLRLTKHHSLLQFHCQSQSTRLTSLPAEPGGDFHSGELHKLISCSSKWKILQNKCAQTLRSTYKAMKIYTKKEKRKAISHSAAAFHRHLVKMHCKRRNHKLCQKFWFLCELWRKNEELRNTCCESVK